MDFSYLYLRALQGPAGIQAAWDHLECLYVHLRALLEKEMWDSEQFAVVKRWTGLSVDMCSNQLSVCVSGSEGGTRESREQWAERRIGKSFPAREQLFIPD